MTGRLLAVSGLTVIPLEAVTLIPEIHAASVKEFIHPLGARRRPFTIIRDHGTVHRILNHGRQEITVRPLAIKKKAASVFFGNCLANISSSSS